VGHADSFIEQTRIPFRFIREVYPWHDHSPGFRLLEWPAPSRWAEKSLVLRVLPLWSVPAERKRGNEPPRHGEHTFHGGHPSWFPSSGPPCLCGSNRMRPTRLSTDRGWWKGWRYRFVSAICVKPKRRRAALAAAVHIVQVLSGIAADRNVRAPGNLPRLSRVGYWAGFTGKANRVTLHGARSIPLSASCTGLS